MSEKEKNSAAEFNLGMILRSTNKLPDVEKLRANLQKHMPRSRISVAAFENTLIEINIDDVTVTVGLIDAPYPAKTLEAEMESTRLFPNAKEALAGQTCHLVVFLPEFKGTMVRKALLLTRILAALCEDPASLGVSWAVPTTLIAPKLFSEMAALASFDNPPVYLWFDMRVGKNSDGTYGGYTRGVDTFGFKDFEFRSTRSTPKELDNLLISFICYLFENGDVLKDGDTIGFTATQKIKICYEPSKIQPGKTIYSLYD